MKRKLLTLLLVFTVLGAMAGCGSKQTPSASSGPVVQTEKDVPKDTERTVTLDTVGVKYTLPDNFSGNILSRTYQTEDIFFLGKYDFVSETTKEALNTMDAEVKDTDYKPLFYVVVVREENVEKDSVKELFGSFSSVDLVSQQQGYQYYILTGSSVDTSDLTEEEKKTYEELCTSAKEVRKTMGTFEFDPKALEKQAEELSKYISFRTKTIEGEEIDSSVFAAYDLTLFVFWQLEGTNKDIAGDLQEIYASLQKDHPEINLIEAIIDLPDESKSEIALEQKSNAKGSYTAIVLDDTLASWVRKNLNGVPTYLLIDSSGKIVDNAIEGYREPSVLIPLAIDAAGIGIQAETAPEDTETP